MLPASHRPRCRPATPPPMLRETEAREDDAYADLAGIAARRTPAKTTPPPSRNRGKTDARGDYAAASAPRIHFPDRVCPCVASSRPVSLALKSLISNF
jgi:hypothetical protein